MGRNPPLVRQWTLLRVLCARPEGATIRQLMQELGASEKTVRRDLELFRRVGFPLHEAMGDHGRKSFCIQAEPGQPALRFAFDEAVAIYLGRRFLDPLAGTVFWDAAQRAFRKLRGVISPQTQKYLDKFAGVFHHAPAGASDYSRKGELIDCLVMAMEDRRVTRITYQSLQATEPITYEVDPYGMVHYRGSLYLVGWSPRRQRVQHWKIDRIEEVEVSEQRFQRPEGFDLKTHLAKSFGIFHGEGDIHVQVRFASRVARYVQEGCWHSSQQLTPQPDGSLIAEFHLSTTEEIKRWLLSFGRHAEVLQPDALRHEMVEEVHALLSRYCSSKVTREQLPSTHDRPEPIP